MTEKYIIFSLEDEKAKKLGEAIANQSCKKIVNFLAEREASASDISRELEMPLNSVDYNLKKLVGAGIIERTKRFFWSSKGKKIENYKVVNKVIVISPKRTNVYSKLKGIVPVIIFSAILTLLIGAYYGSQSFGSVQKSSYLPEGGNLMAAAPSVAETITSAAGSSNPLAWFIAGGILVLVIFAIWNWKKL